MRFNAADRILDAMDDKRTPCIVGLDPTVEELPSYLFDGNSFHDVARAFERFNCEILDAVCDLVPAVKPQIAFYEGYEHEGMRAFKKTVDYARSKGLVVIEDGKRNDIFKTAKAYADGHLGTVAVPGGRRKALDLDFLTVSSYLWTDTFDPFVEVCKEHGKGIFIMAKTSNPSAAKFQDRLIDISEDEQEELERVGIQCDGRTAVCNLSGIQINRYARQCVGESGYSPIGAVVGATYPEQAKILRRIMPVSFFLVPGYGTQGGTGDDIVYTFNDDGYGAVINSGSKITFSYRKKYPDGSSMYRPEQFAEAARDATKEMIEDVNGALKRAGKLPKEWIV